MIDPNAWMFVALALAAAGAVGGFFVIDYLGIVLRKPK